MTTTMHRSLSALALLALALAFPSATRADAPAAIAGGALVALGSGVACGTAVLAREDEDEAASEEPAYDRRGFVAGLGASYGANLFEEDLKEKFPVVTEADTDNSFGVSGSLGYRCQRRFSVEVQTEWYDRFKTDLKTFGPPRKLGNHEFEPIVFTSNVKAYLLTDQIQPFVLVGAGGMTAKQKLRDKTLGSKRSERQSDFAMRFGGGVDYYYTENVVLNFTTSYVRPFGGLDDFDYVSIVWGAAYRF